MAPLTNTAWASTVTNTGTPGQNVPGAFGGDESGFILPAATYTVSGVTYTAGLADFGTRLKAVFTNIPAGLTLYVSTTSTGSEAVPGGADMTLYAVLVASSQSNEANNDGAALSPIAGTVTGSDGLGAYPLTPDSNGAAAAVWEVVNSAGHTLMFSVYVAYRGQPQSTGQPGQPTNNVALSFSPEPGGGTFSQANALDALTNPVPRFQIVTPQQGSWVTINSCTLSASNATVPFVYTTGGATPPSQTLPVTISPGNLSVTVTPSVTTPVSRCRRVRLRRRGRCDRQDIPDGRDQHHRWNRTPRLHQ